MFETRFRTVLALASSLAASACAVGPNFQKPTAPANAGFAPMLLPSVTASAPINGGAAQRLLSGQDVQFDWWTAFRCPQIDSLVEKALRTNPTIESAKAALAQAQELVYAQQGYFFPTIGASYNFERQKLAGNLSGSAAPGVQGNGSAIQATQNPNPNPPPHNVPLFFNFHTATLTISYDPDVFGGNRRQVESLDAQAQMQRFEMAAAYISLASNVVAAAIQQAELQAQIAATQDIIDAETKSLEILRNQQRFGQAMAIDVAAQEAALAAVEQTLPPLQKQMEQTRDLLRALAGNLPNQDVEETCQLSSLHLPEDLPLSLPSKIVEQRPDVRAAEEQMRSANAQVGVAIANRLPQFNLTGSYGGVATEFLELSSPGAGFWTLAGNIAQTLFDGGTLLHRERAADQALIQAAAQYRSTVITAFQNVADTLHALLSDADSLKAAVTAERAAKVTLDITQRQSEVGYVNYLTLLSAQQAYQTALINLVQAQSTRFGDTAALFQALGGGWWNRSDVAVVKKHSAIGDAADLFKGP